MKTIIEEKREIQSQFHAGLIRFEKACEEYARLREKYNMQLGMRKVMMNVHFKGGFLKGCEFNPKHQ